MRSVNALALAAVLAAPLVRRLGHDKYLGREAAAGLPSPSLPLRAPPGAPTG